MALRKISNRDAVHILTAFIEIVSFDPNNCFINRSSIKIKREQLKAEKRCEGEKYEGEVIFGREMGMWNYRILNYIFYQPRKAIVKNLQKKR